MNDSSIPSIDVHELNDLRNAHPDLTIIDVREQHEWDQIHIPGAIHIPKDAIADKIKDHCQDTKAAIYLHCRSGVRSVEAAQNLKAMGYSNLYSVSGGIMEWAMAGYEVKES